MKKEKPKQVKRVSKDQTKKVKLLTDKEKDRVKILKCITNSFDTRDKLNVLTLPGRSYELETELMNKYKKLNLVCLEKNKSIYEKSKTKGESLAKVHNSKFCIHNIVDDEYFKKCKIKFNVIWLDYETSWTPEMFAAIKNILHKNLDFSKKPPILAITLRYDFYKFKCLQPKPKGYRTVLGLIKFKLAPDFIYINAHEYHHTISLVSNRQYKLKGKLNVGIQAYIFKVHKDWLHASNLDIVI